MALAGSAAAPTTAPAAAPPAIAPPEPSGPLLGLWITAFALANVYAAVFLAVAYLNAHPQALRRATRWLPRGGAGPAANGSSREARHAGHPTDRRAAGGGSDGSGGMPSASGGGATAETGQQERGEGADAAPAAIAAATIGHGAPPSSPPPVALEWRGVSLSVAGAKGRRWILQVRGGARDARLPPLPGQHPRLQTRVRRCPQPLMCPPPPGASPTSHRDPNAWLTDTHAPTHAPKRLACRRLRACMGTRGRGSCRRSWAHPGLASRRERGASSRCWRPVRGGHGGEECAPLAAVGGKGPPCMRPVPRPGPRCRPHAGSRSPMRAAPSLVLAG